ncbi:MAG: LamG domain-containing protein [bacterium]|nr:LamG domain-containing protein [bacterium]
MAMVANNKKVRIYLNGEKIGEEEYSGSPWVNTSKNLKAGLGLGGAMDEVRISDVARYADLNFTPPTAPFVCDENTRALWHFDETGRNSVYHDICGVDNFFSKNGIEPFPWILFIPALIKKK